VTVESNLPSELGLCVWLPIPWSTSLQWFDRRRFRSQPRLSLPRGTRIPLPSRPFLPCPSGLNSTAPCRLALGKPSALRRPALVAEIRLPLAAALELRHYRRPISPTLGAERSLSHRRTLACCHRPARGLPAHQRRAGPLWRRRPTDPLRRSGRIQHGPYAARGDGAFVIHWADLRRRHGVPICTLALRDGERSPARGDSDVGHVVGQGDTATLGGLRSDVAGDSLARR
jgi:hypothetical protein